MEQNVKKIENNKIVYYINGQPMTEDQYRFLLKIKCEHYKPTTSSGEKSDYTTYS